MNHKLKCSLAMSCFCLTLSLATSMPVNGYVDSLHFTPTHPIPGDTIVIQVFGQWPDLCYESETSEIVILGDTVLINIDGFAGDCQYACADMMKPYTLIETISPLSENRYVLWFHETELKICDSVLTRRWTWDSYFALSIPTDDCGECVPGDTNRDGGVNIYDVWNLVRFMFTLGEYPVCERAADADSNGRITIGDISAIISYIFLEGSLTNCDPDYHFRK